MTQPQSFNNMRALAGVCALLASVAMGNVQAQSRAMDAAMAPAASDSNVPAATAQKQAREMAQGDPARWFHEDFSAAARLRSLQKEIGAALQEAQGACGRLQAAERKACMNEARATYKKDMAGAQAQVMAERG